MLDDLSASSSADPGDTSTNQAQLDYITGSFECHPKVQQRITKSSE